MSGKEPPKPPKKDNQLRRYAQLSGIGFQMGATIFVCSWIGKKLDAHFQTQKDWFTIGFILFGVAASIYVLIKQLNRINKED